VRYLRLDSFECRLGCSAGVSEVETWTLPHLKRTESHTATFPRFYPSLQFVVFKQFKSAMHILSSASFSGPIAALTDQALAEKRRRRYTFEVAGGN
jgi:hypothetical protein